MLEKTLDSSENALSVAFTDCSVLSPWETSRTLCSKAMNKTGATATRSQQSRTQLTREHLTVRPELVHWLGLMCQQQVTCYFHLNWTSAGKKASSFWHVFGRQSCLVFMGQFCAGGTEMSWGVKRGAVVGPQLLLSAAPASYSFLPAPLWFPPQRMQGNLCFCTCSLLSSSLFADLFHTLSSPLCVFMLFCLFSSMFL